MSSPPGAQSAMSSPSTDGGRKEQGVKRKLSEEFSQVASPGTRTAAGSPASSGSPGGRVARKEANLAVGSISSNLGREKFYIKSVVKLTSKMQKTGNIKGWPQSHREPKRHHLIEETDTVFINRWSMSTSFSESPVSLHVGLKFESGSRKVLDKICSKTDIENAQNRQHRGMATESESQRGTT